MPGRLISAWPSGIEKPESTGTGPFLPCSRIVSMNRHGSGSKIAEVSRPLPSRGVDGTITFIPGMCMNHASRDCECVAPVARPAYTWVRMVIGADRPACRHESQLGAVVDQLVRGDSDEVHDHDLGHRQQPVHRGTDGRTDDRGLRDRGVQYPVVPVLCRQPRGRAGCAGIGDVLTEQEHSVVGLPTPDPARGSAPRASSSLFLAMLFQGLTPGT